MTSRNKALGFSFFLALIFVFQPALTADLRGLAEYRQGDFRAAYTQLRPLAEKGNTEAQFLAGVIMSQGESLKDMEAAARWYRRAADQGYVPAQAKLGACYASGSGVPQSDAEAIIWYRRAAEKGDAAAASHLGYLYAYGTNMPHDKKESAYWYQRAAVGEQGRKRYISPDETLQAVVTGAGQKSRLEIKERETVLAVQEDFVFDKVEWTPDSRFFIVNGTVKGKSLTFYYSRVFNNIKELTGE